MDDSTRKMLADSFLATAIVLMPPAEEDDGKRLIFEFYEPEERARFLEGRSCDTVGLSRAHAVNLCEAMDWMIQHLEFENSETGLDQGPSPELQDAQIFRDALRRRIDG
jgi:hypothetical protein